jgi:MYXO-CTERM domain-containing protein
MRTLSVWWLARCRSTHSPFWLLTFVLCGLLLSPRAWADRVAWRETTVKEQNGAWNVRVEFFLDRAPEMASVPMKFTFTAKTYFEAALVDGRDKPLIREVPITEMSSVTFERVISVDLEPRFSDPASGKVFKQTRLSFALPRSSGFVAGEYEVEVENARTAKSLGKASTLRLNGQNEVVDRRSVVMTQKKPSSAPAQVQAPAEPELSPEDDGFWQGGNTTPAEPRSALPPPAHLQQKPGCGCRVAQADGERTAGLWAAAGGVLALWARRRVASKEAAGKKVLGKGAAGKSV